MVRNRKSEREQRPRATRLFGFRYGTVTQLFANNAINIENIKKRCIISSRTNKQKSSSSLSVLPILESKIDK